MDMENETTAVTPQEDAPATLPEEGNTSQADERDNENAGSEKPPEILEKPGKREAFEEKSRSSVAVADKPENMYTAFNLFGPTAGEMNCRERLEEIEDMERSLKERAFEAAINILSQSTPEKKRTAIPEPASVSFAVSDDLRSKVKQLEGKIKTINRRLQESKREKNQLEARIQILELQLFAQNNETLISEMLNQTPTDADIETLERIKESIKIRAERVKAIHEAERKANVLSKVIESADGLINSLPVFLKYKESVTDADISEEPNSSKSHDLITPVFPKPVDIITFESEENLVRRDSPTKDVRRSKSSISDIKLSKDDEGNKFKMFRKGSNSGSQ